MKKVNCLFILILLYLMVRLSVIFLGTGEIYDQDELHIGTITKELMEGPILPLIDYQDGNYEGGSLIIALLRVPFFLLFGPRYLSFKLATLLFPLGILVLLYLFLCRFFNRRVAILAGLLFILSPPMYTRLSLIAFGNHLESSLFTIAVMYIFYKIFFSEDQKVYGHRNYLFYFILLGLVSGFASWFCYTFLITLFVLFIFWFILDKKFLLKRQFLLFSFSFLIGFSPWLYTHLLKWNLAGLDIAKEGFFTPPYGLARLSYFISRLKSLFIYYLPQSMNFRDFGIISKELFSYTYYFIFVLSFLGLVWVNRVSLLRFFLNSVPFRKDKLSSAHISKEIFLLIYPIIFLLVYAFSSFDFHEFRYFAPLYPFIFVIISLFLDKLWRKALKAQPAIFVVTVLIVIGMIGNLSLISLGGFKRASQYKGFQYYRLGFSLVRRYGYNIEKCITAIEKLKEEYRRHVYRGVAHAIASKFEKDRDTGRWLDCANKVKQDYRRYFYVYLQEAISEVYSDKAGKVITLIDSIDEEYRPYLYEGLSWVVAARLDGDISKCTEFINTLDEEYKLCIPHLWYITLCKKFQELNVFDRNDINRFITLINKIPTIYKPYVYRKLGESIGNESLDDIGVELQSINMNKVRATASLIPEEYRAYLYDSFAEAIALELCEDVALCLDLIDQVEADYRADAYRGLGKGLAWVYGEDVDIITKLIDKQLDAKYRPYLYQGLEYKTD